MVVIDHHRMMVTHIENAIIFYHEPYASSASEMVAELVQYINSSALNKKKKRRRCFRHYAGHEKLRFEDGRAHI